MPATPAQADPDIKDVKAKVDRLYHEAEAAQERLHDARLDLADLRGDLSGLKADQERQDERLDAVRAQVSDAVVRQLEGEGISTVGQIVVSEDPGAFLDSLSTMSSFNDLQSSLLSDYDTELEALEIRQEATADRTAEIAELTEQLSVEKETVDDKLADAKELLADLEAEERERLLASRGSARMPASVPASGRAAAAVQYAMAQVGDAYVYGAMGENAFDCSGLTMRAWAQAGVSLPHSSSAQFSSGPRIAASDLQPGDLVFYYSPISHVGMYIGNGMIVHAANPGTGVAVSGLYSMPYVGAVRPG
ncbi:cell wall-associated NlpC family hydrolase [Nocardioides cavernae]|uniref:Cell wall-associated NlpC family hydrolase n=1 Tax=Nocardioides cavernae TaxID=1921566 RepID=A0A7Y9H6P1_9ACTN|nr:NlpC/P60 family protein [Nocardioides cavernae]NYE38903.1 cell wall-associated NlpC family hydrolase [Nocardioides cavernae]